MEVGHRKGMDRLSKADAPLTELEKWVADTVAPALDSQKVHAREKLKGKVMAISACYFAASIEGVDLASKDDEAVMHKVGDAVATMKAKLAVLKKQVRDDPTCLKDEGDGAQRKKRKTDRMNLCNLTLQTMLYETFFDMENCEICFKRNWVLPSVGKPELDEKGNPKPNFRTTWSAGWYIDRRRKEGVKFDAAPINVLSALDEYEKALKHSFKPAAAGIDNPCDVSFQAAPAPEQDATAEEEKEDSVYFSVNENASWEEWGRRLRREWGGMNDDPDEGSQWTDEEWGLWAKEQINALWDDSQGDVPTDEEWVEWGKRVFCHAGITVNDDWTNEAWVKWGKELCWNARMVTLNVEWANWAKSEWAKWGDGPAGDWSSAEWTEWGKSLFAMTVV